MPTNTPQLVYVDIYQAMKTTAPDSPGGRPQHWRWRATNGNNHRVLAVSSEAYTNESDCLDAIQELFSNGTDVYLRQTEQGDQQLRLASQ